MGLFKALGISRPEPLFGLGVRSVEFTPARIRAEVVGAVVVSGCKLGLARVEGLAAYGIHGGFRGGVVSGHESTSLHVDGMVCQAVVVTAITLMIIPIFSNGTHGINQRSIFPPTGVYSFSHECTYSPGQYQRGFFFEQLTHQFDILV